MWLRGRHEDRQPARRTEEGTGEGAARVETFGPCGARALRRRPEGTGAVPTSSNCDSHHAEEDEDDEYNDKHEPDVVGHSGTST